MALPIVLYYILFEYIPLGGVVIAFQDFSPAKGFFGSDWVGLRHFADFLSSAYASRVIKNTILINLYEILFEFPAPIILALLINEIRCSLYKKTIQTISYMPHFISLVVICGIIVDFTQLNGLINDVIVLLGGERSILLARKDMFRTIFVSSGIWQHVGWGSIIYLATLSRIDPSLIEASVIDGASQYIRSYAENEVYQEMEKRTGIQMEYIHPASGQEAEQFNIMIASGEIPDTIQGANYYKGGIQKGVDDGVFLDLTPYAQKYAPDYYKLVYSTPNIKRQCVFDGEKILAFFRIKTEKEVPFERILTRRDWLAEAGMQEPGTIADWEAYLKYIRENKEGVAPYVLRKSGIEPVSLAAYNIMAGFYLKDGKQVAYGQTQPEFREYLTLMNRWYNAGYISKDFLSLKEAKVLAEFIGGRTAVIEDAVSKAFVNVRAGSDIDLVSTPYPRLNPGDKLHCYVSEWENSGSDTVVSAATEYKTEAIRWLNYAYTREGSMLFNYGIEGKSYVMENGEPKFTDYMLKDSKYPLGAKSHILKVHVAPKLCDSDMKCNPNVLAEGQKSIDIRMKWSDDKDVDGQYVLPPLRLTLEESKARSKIMADVDTYVSEMVLKFIIGEEPLSNFDNFVNRIKELNIDEAVQITQKAYERYMQ